MRAAQTSEQLLWKPVFGSPAYSWLRDVRMSSGVLGPQKAPAEESLGSKLTGTLVQLSPERNTPLSSLDGGCTISGIILPEDWKIPSIPYTSGPRPQVVPEPSISDMQGSGDRMKGDLGSCLLDSRRITVPLQGWEP